jgi:hypothetical protein
MIDFQENFRFYRPETIYVSSGFLIRAKTGIKPNGIVNLGVNAFGMILVI